MRAVRYPGSQARAGADLRGPAGRCAHQRSSASSPSKLHGVSSSSRCREVAVPASASPVGRSARAGAGSFQCPEQVGQRRAGERGFRDGGMVCSLAVSCPGRCRPWTRVQPPRQRHIGPGELAQWDAGEPVRVFGPQVRLNGAKPLLRSVLRAQAVDARLRQQHGEGPWGRGRAGRDGGDGSGLGPAIKWASVCGPGRRASGAI